MTKTTKEIELELNAIQDGETFVNTKYYEQSDFDQLRKKINWELQHHIKGEYTIFQTKHRIKNIFDKFSRSKDKRS